MKNTDAEKYIRELIDASLKKLGWPIESLIINRPREEKFGDFATPVAMGLAKSLKKNPRLIAEEIVAALDYDRDFVTSVSIDGPGFVNFKLGVGYWHNVLEQILSARENFGKSDWGREQKINIEFVSANPTGPLNIVSARAASIGDVMGNLLRAVGAEVAKEYYINDAGQRVKSLGDSVSSHYMSLFGIDEPFPEDGYHGEYVKDLAVALRDEFGDRFVSMSVDERSNKLTDLALERMVASQKKALEEFRVQYDVWFSEQSLLDSKREEEVLEQFEKNKQSYKKEGALWFRASEFGDREDRVLLKRDGEPTYFLGDIAYHVDKYRRGFDQLYDLWGPDHHSHIDRMKAALNALGYKPGSFEVKIIQQVNLLRGGEVVKMSKRSGNIIEMKELIDEVGVDAARYFFLMRTLESPLDFDIDLAKKQSNENPVYYAQYAHARACSIFARAADDEVHLSDEYDATLLQSPEEIAVLKKLSEYPEVVSKAAHLLEPHRITTYLQELATVFHQFYHECRVVSEEAALTQARLHLVEGVRTVLANAFKLLNVTAPEKMIRNGSKLS